MENMNNKTRVPKWAKHAVWYQIFPDRFRNANNFSNPKLDDIQGTSPWDIDEKTDWQIHPWSSDWYKMLPYEKSNGKSFWKNVLRRRYGGDLQGIIDKLNYLENLGINAIYLNPIFYSPSLHKYDQTCYHHIDPNFGNNPERDKKTIKTENFDEIDSWKWTSADILAFDLIEEAHKKGIKIIFDGVFHHIGYNSIPFQDVMKKRKKSKYKDWFIVDWEKSTSEKLEYEKFWTYVHEMPKLNYKCKAVKNYIFSITKRWMQPAVNGKIRSGIDGWRLDHAIGVPIDFWREWTAFVKAINPDAYITGELIEEVKDIKPFLQTNIFDAITNYNLLFLIAQFFIDVNQQLIPSEFAKKIKNLLEQYPDEVNFAMQNLISSHDFERISSYTVNKKLKKFGSIETYLQNSKANTNNYKTGKPNAEEKQVLKQITIFQFTFVGAPMIYYGDEVGMWGANDPCCRKPMIWEDISYENERYKPNGKKIISGYKVEQDKDMLSLYKKLIKVRSEYICLRQGNYKTIITDDKKSIFAYSREFKNEKIIVIFNLDERNHEIEIKFINNHIFVDLLNENKNIKVKNQKLQLKMSAKEAKILLIK